MGLAGNPIDMAADGWRRFLKRQSSPAEIPANLRKELTSIFPESGDWKIAGRVRVRRDGEFFRAWSARMGASVAIKVFTRQIPPALADSRLLDLLGSYHSNARGNPLMTIPRTYAVTREPDAVLMEWIDAPVMIDLLRKHRFSRAKRLRHIEMAGRWLGWFHSLSKRVREPYDPGAIKNKFARMIQTRGSRPAAALAGHLESWGEITARIGPFEVDHAVLHRDFTPFNLFMDPDRVTGFDLFAQDRGPVTHDICRFLTYLDIHRFLPVSASALKHHGCGKSGFDAFMKGYGMSAGEIPRHLFLYLQYTEILRRWLSLDTQRTKGGFRARRVLQTARLARMAKHARAGL